LGRRGSPELTTALAAFHSPVTKTGATGSFGDTDGWCICKRHVLHTVSSALLSATSASPDQRPGASFTAGCPIGRAPGLRVLPPHPRLGLKAPIRTCAYVDSLEWSRAALLNVAQLAP
jgi:hypothetical protein